MDPTNDKQFRIQINWDMEIRIHHRYVILVSLYVATSKDFVFESVDRWCLSKCLATNHKLSCIILVSSQLQFTGIGSLNGKNWPNSATLPNKRAIGKLAEFGQFLPFKRSIPVYSSWNGHRNLQVLEKGGGGGRRGCNRKEGRRDEKERRNEDMIYCVRIWYFGGRYEHRRPYNEIWTL